MTGPLDVNFTARAMKTIRGKNNKIRMKALMMFNNRIEESRRRYFSASSASVSRDLAMGGAMATEPVVRDSDAAAVMTGSRSWNGAGEGDSKTFSLLPFTRERTEHVVLALSFTARPVRNGGSGRAMNVKY
jgi:hypothetical protein